MKRLILILVIPLILGACGIQSTPIPTPLPTAVPPSEPLAEGGDWAVSFDYEIPDQVWAEGVHRYRVQLHCPGVIEDSTSEWVYFDVTEDATILSTPVYLRLQGLSTGVLAGQNLSAVHPEQKTIAVVTLVGLSETSSQLAIDNCICLFRWDNNLMQMLTPQESFIP